MSSCKRRLSGYLVCLLILNIGTLMSCSVHDVLYNPSQSVYEEPAMVVIPTGRYTMGNSAKVFLSSFELARYELTWAEWEQCENDGGCSRLERYWSNRITKTEQLRHPVVNTKLSHANEYINWLNQKTGRNYRLPSEAEWEYAARAGSSTHYYWGDNIGIDHANCQGCNSPWDGRHTSPVGSFDANPFALHDMLGNVAEWVADCWYVGGEGHPRDGTARVDDCSAPQARILKGGSWINIPRSLRAVSRVRNNADVSRVDIGFRLARSLP